MKIEKTLQNCYRLEIVEKLDGENDQVCLYCLAVNVEEAAGIARAWIGGMQKMFPARVYDLLGVSHREAGGGFVRISDEVVLVAGSDD